jgi:hypothetical protein
MVIVYHTTLYKQIAKSCVIFGYMSVFLLNMLVSFALRRRLMIVRLKVAHLSPESFLKAEPHPIKIATAIVYHYFEQTNCNVL